ncbi:DUF4365 domain-containing protein [Microbacterium sp. LMI12-1-1.1]|uniref:DUF4365 domain-containing protein n=1 Tax=Microbacterium sp. LWS13-1.2 TaxID=3135264 RepID=A0AAU6S9V9_9MICO
MSTVGTPAPLPLPPIVRGSPKRFTDLMEAYQEGLVRAIAAASGVVVSRPEIDEGIDLTLTHRSDVHTHVESARLEVQLKSTYTASTTTGFSVQISRDRYDYLRTPNPSIAKILIVMSVPPSQDDWIHATDKRARVHNAAYWVNLEGMPSSAAAEPTVTAPFTQRFDDRALCDMMVRIGKGGAP